MVPVSTHEQVLGGATGQTYVGCRFPADEAYRRRIQDEALKVAAVLLDRGVISRFAIDFVAWLPAGSAEWEVAAIEINLRMGSTTFPFLALEFLTGGRLDPADGLYYSRRGSPKYYVSTDALKSPRYRGLLAEDLFDILIEHQLYFDPGSETGALFHMIGALSEYGKLGLICIGDSTQDAQRIYDAAVAVLDAHGPEAGPPDPGAASLLPEPVRRIE